MAAFAAGNIEHPLGGLAEVAGALGMLAVILRSPSL